MRAKLPVAESEAMFRVWGRQARPALGRRVESARHYHTRSCFGHRVKPSPKVEGEPSEQYITLGGV